MSERSQCDVLIAIPHSGLAVNLEWAVNFSEMWKHAPVRTKLLLVPEPQIDVAREKAVEIGFQLGAEHLLFLDSDIHPPRDVIAKLLSHKVPIISALYSRRQNPPWNQMLRLAPDGLKYQPIEEGSYQAGSIVECDAVGFGCVLIELSVFKGMEKPWFRWTEHYAPSGLSEDFNFCLKAKRNGFKILVDTSIICKHSGFIKWLPSKSMNRFEYSQVSGVFGD